MQWIRVMIIGAMVWSAGMANEYFRCHEYHATDFRIGQRVPFERVVLAAPKVWPQNTIQPLILLFLDKSGREEKASQYLFCTWNEEKALYRCGGECDAGELFLEKDLSMRLMGTNKLEVDIPVDPYQEEKRTHLDLRKGIEKAKAQKVTCPLYTERLFNPEALGGYSADPLLNVCYTAKSKQGAAWIYEGCLMNAKPCKQIGKQHFGHYENVDSAYQAFLRCVDAVPLQ